MTYTCCDENRREATRRKGGWNGIDWLEVVDAEAPSAGLRQRILVVRLLLDVPAGFNRENVRIEGGERVRHVKVLEAVGAAEGDGPPAWYPFAGADASRVLLILTDRRGDFSTYRLRLLPGAGADFDPRLLEAPFAFKVECPSDLDCAPDCSCEDTVYPTPDIDYLVKDYAGFRRLMLDRIRRLVPGWRERTPADLGVTLVELLADAADQLSYWQDAVATEAYLETARLRTSLRRHALLVDYRMHEGSNARAWVQVQVSENRVPLTKPGVHFLTRAAGAPGSMAPGSREEKEALKESPLVFEPMHESVLHAAHNEISFYTWEDERCCLEPGSTSATLRDPLGPRKRLRLRRGDVLVFQEKVGPRTGEVQDADPSKRHAVRLTRVDPEAAADGSPGPRRVDPLTGQGIVDIAWASADALPFPLCLSSQEAPDVTVALGNIVLADHGETVEDEELGSVPAASLFYPPPGEDGCEPQDAEPLPPRFRPLLARGPLTWVGHVPKSRRVAGTTSTELVPFDPEGSAASALSWKMTDVLPALLSLTSGAGAWTVQRDLLDSGGTSRHVVVEAEHDGSCRLRFGDDRHGRRPDEAEAFVASYRVGSGIPGNVGAGAIAHVVSADARLTSASNPLPALGGALPETADQVRRRAPRAFRRQERAVTVHDYAEVTERLQDVQRAAARLRWTGSWHTVFVTVDRAGGDRIDSGLETTVLGHVERYRMAGHDLRVHEPRFIALELTFHVCVAEDYFRADVQAELLRVLRAAFHPDNFTFGQSVYLSPFQAAAHDVAGVASVEVRRFGRLGQDDPGPLRERVLHLAPLEIARLDNDPNRPENGVLRLELHGGK